MTSTVTKHHNEKMARSVLFLLVNALVICSVVANYAFLSIGDWGGAQLGDEYSTNVYAVSDQLATTSTDSDAQFIIGTGDNFYWCGIQNTTDPQISVDFEQPYSHAALQKPWYHALGVSFDNYIYEYLFSFNLLNFLTES